MLILGLSHIALNTPDIERSTSRLACSDIRRGLTNPISKITRRSPRSSSVTSEGIISAHLALRAG